MQARRTTGPNALQTLVQGLQWPQAQSHLCPCGRQQKHQQRRERDTQHPLKTRHRFVCVFQIARHTQAPAQPLIGPHRALEHAQAGVAWTGQFVGMRFAIAQHIRGQGQLRVPQRT